MSAHWSDFSHYNDVIMSAMASQITSLTSVYSTVYSGADQRKYQNSASLAFVRRIHRWPVNSPHKGPVTPKMIPVDVVIMKYPNTVVPGHSTGEVRLATPCVLIERDIFQYTGGTLSRYFQYAYIKMCVEHKTLNVASVKLINFWAWM